MTGFVLILLLLQVAFLLWQNRALSRRSADPAPGSQQRNYSIIIAARNEEEYIGGLLEALTRQNYPATQFEVVLCADRCSDGTIAIAGGFRDRLELHILDIPAVPQDVSPKKQALEQGINSARYNHLIFLDADVLPTARHLSLFDAHFEHSDVVVGLMAFCEPQNIWQRFLVCEKLLSWCVANAGITSGRPNISYGGNWGYTRAIYERVGGFADIRSSLSGDDDLLLQRFGEAGARVALAVRPESWIRMDFPDSFRDFLRQRRRHFSAGQRYRRSLQLGYLLYHGSNLLLWVLAFFSLPALLALGVKMLGDWLLLRHAARVFSTPQRLADLLPFELLFVLYNTLIGPMGHVGRVRW